MGNAYFVITITSITISIITIIIINTNIIITSNVTYKLAKNVANMPSQIRLGL